MISSVPSVAALVALLLVSLTTATNNAVVYRATITPLSLGGAIVNTPNVQGFVRLFQQPDSPIVGYTGIVTGVESNLFAKTCNATNGCGVHIHSGTSCFNSTTQGGHYYDNSTYPIDPWINERYSSSSAGKTSFNSIVEMGNLNIEGHAFIVHSFNGTRIGCGIIERVPTGKNFIYSTKTASLSGTNVDGTVIVVPVEPGTVCYYGSATNLEPNLISYLNQNRTFVGTDCNFTNGCGVHVHNGTSCFNRTTQGGHYWNEVQYPIDPWLTTMYEATNAVGSAKFVGCVEMGVPVSTIIDKPFVIHSNNGTRVACGLLNSDGPNATFIVIDPITDKHIGALRSTIDYATLGTSTNYLNMKVDFLRNYRSAFVTFGNPSRATCETVLPFSILGDNQGNFHSRVIPLGSNTVTATPYNSANCSGVPAGPTVSQTFLVKGCYIDYIVRNARTKAVITTITPGATITRSSTAVNVQANITCGFAIRNVTMVYRRGSRVLRNQVENEAPYYLYGNNGENISPGVTFNSAGAYSITTTINELNHGSVNFTISA